MASLPDRTGDPKDSEFGAATAPQPQTNGHVSQPQALPTQADTPFAEFVSCFLCGAQLSSAVAEGRKFWMTSCDHVLCSSHAHEKGKCTSCGQTGIATYIIDKELRTFLRAGGQLLGNVEHGSSIVVASSKALKYQGEQLMRSVRTLQAQLALAREKASMASAIFEKSKADKEAWEREKAALQSEIAELRNIVSVNGNGAEPYAPHRIAAPLPSIEEEQRSGLSANADAQVLGKRSHDGSSPSLRRAPAVDRITLPPRGTSSSGPYSSPHSSSRHLEQVRSSLGQFRYNATPEPQTLMNGRHAMPYRPSSATPYLDMQPMHMTAIGPFQAPLTPAPNNVVASLRQNGRSERDDSPRRPVSSMATPQTPNLQAMPMQSAPSPYRPTLNLPGSPAPYYQTSDRGAQAQLAVPRHRPRPKF